MFRLSDRNGQEPSSLPLGPPSPPLEERPVRTLAPGERLELSFSLEQFTDDRLRRKPYRMECCYDTTWLPQEAEVRIDRITACATPLIVR
jgi:hypothetical protein